MPTVTPAPGECAPPLAVEQNRDALILDFPTPDTDGGVLLEDGLDEGLADVLSQSQPCLGARLLKFGRSVVNNAGERLPVVANQAVHGFGSERFWSQYRDTTEVETSFGTVHQVRRVYSSSTNPEEAENVLVINPLGTSSQGGYMAEVANIFYKAGFVVWNVSPPGFEGKLPTREAAKLTVRRETQYAEEAIRLAAAKLDIEPPIMHTFGGSQGGGMGIGLQNRALTHGTPIGKTYAVTPCSGKNSTSLEDAPQYAKQFMIDEPRALARHIRNHPRGPIRRSLQLAPTLNPRFSALKQIIGGGFGLIFRPGHDEFIEAARTPEVKVLLEGSILVVCLGSDVVARGVDWPDYMTREDPGRFHLDLMDERYPTEAIDFFRQLKAESAEAIA